MVDKRMSSTVAPAGVVDAIRNKNAVVFVGAGLSVLAGLPTASALASFLTATLRELRVNTYGLEPHLEQVSELFETSLGRVRLANEVERQLSTTALSDISAAHLFLAKLVKHGFINTIVTTNYDTLIEDACAAVGVRLRVIAHPSLMYHAGERTPVILKLHGDFLHPNLLVLTPRDYSEFETNELRRPLIVKLKELIQVRPIIFLGYSVQDPNFLRLLQQVRVDLPDSSRPPSYAAVYDVANFDNTMERLWQYGIRAFQAEDTAGMLLDILWSLNIKLLIGHLIFQYPDQYPDQRARYGGIETFFEILNKYSSHKHELLGALTIEMYQRTQQRGRGPRDLVYPASFYYFRAATTAAVQEILARKHTGEHVPDVIHAHFLAFSDYLYDIDFPTICTSHSLLSTDLAFTRGIFDGVAAPGTEHELRAVRKAEHSAAGKIKYINALSNSHKEELVRLGAPNVSVITAPFSHEPFINYDGTHKEARESIDLPERFTITYVGRPDRRKGIEVLIKACGILYLKVQDFQLMLVGFGFSYSNDNHALSFALGRFAIDTQEFTSKGGEVHLRAPYGGTAALAPYYAASNIIVLPSLYEPMGYVVLESMASARPIVASRTGGIPEMVTHGEAGLLFEPGNAEELAAYLARLFSDPELRTRLGENGRSKILKRETPSDSVRCFDEAYLQVAFGTDFSERQVTISPELERRIDVACDEELQRQSQLTIYEAAMAGCSIAERFVKERRPLVQPKPIDVELYRLVAAKLHSKLRSSAKSVAFPPKALSEMMSDLALSYLNIEDSESKPIQLSAEQTQSHLSIERSIENWFDLEA